ncbi:hypothetical protein DSECCO2_656640 [anaerobic digester metagenome]
MGNHALIVGCGTSADIAVQIDHRDLFLGGKLRSGGVFGDGYHFLRIGLQLLLHLGAGHRVVDQLHAYGLFGGDEEFFTVVVHGAHVIDGDLAVCSDQLENAFKAVGKGGGDILPGTFGK